jgi:uncharacterized protein (DUF362 family)
VTRNTGPYVTPSFSSASDPTSGRAAEPTLGATYERGHGVSRRAFLASLPLIAAACAQPPYRRGDFVLPARSPIGLFPATSYGADLSDVIFRGLELLRPAVAGKRVLLKPNMVEYEPGTPINTDPMVIAGAAQAFLRAGAREVVVGEGPGHRRDIEYLLTATGLYDRLTDLKLRFVDLNHDDVAVRPLRSHFTGLESIALPAALLQSDFIVSLPKLKTHHWAGMTASMKNFFGVVPGAVYGWPKNLLHFRGIAQSIVDLVATVRPHFTIVDAITCMEGDGPIMGRARPLGFLAMGEDLVAVDATCARIIGLDPVKMEYLSWASEYLGNIAERRIEHRGESPNRYRTVFDVVDHIKPLRS